MIVSYPSNIQEVNAIKSVLKALNVKFEIKKDEIVANEEPTKKEVLKNLKAGIKELKLYKQGKLKTTSAKDFFVSLNYE